MSSGARERDKVFVEHCKGANGLDKVVLREVRGSSAEVYLYGGQVTSWKNEYGEELLFVSSKATFKSPKAIRGGIPICFPQFGSLGSLEQHGFARNRFWSIDHDPPPFPTNSGNKAFIDLILKPSEEDSKIWSHRYEFRLRVTLGPGGDLMLTSRIRNTNTDGKSFTFTFAYHTYLFVTDIRFSDAISCYCFEFFIIKFMFPGQLYLTGKHHKHMLLLCLCCFLTSISSAIYLLKTPGYNSFQNRVVKMEW
ncbi:unnamed protein product [Prunus armeniaca]